jgi:hypothetical protein
MEDKNKGSSVGQELMGLEEEEWVKIMMVLVCC